MIRPKKPDSERFLTPARQLGRVSDDDWRTLKSAAEQSGKSFTAWALPILLRAAKKQLGL